MNFVHNISGRGLIAYLHDIIMAGVSFALALYLRLGDDIFFYNPDPMIQGGIVFVIICAGIFWFSGLYRGVWRYASMNDLLAITRAVTLAVVTFLVVLELCGRWRKFRHRFAAWTWMHLCDPLLDSFRLRKMFNKLYVDRWFTRRITTLVDETSSVEETTKMEMSGQP